MTAASFSRANYALALRLLLPRGRAWADEPGSPREGVFEGFAGAFERNDAAARTLVDDAFPANAVDLLPEWEATLGLPDPCAGENPTVQQRQAQVVARLSAPGGQSRAYFIRRAALLGYSITIQEFAPFRAGRSRAGARCYGAEWGSAWAVHGAANPIISEFRAGQSRAGDRLRTWGTAVLECELQALKPAHTTLFFVYS